MKKEDRPGKWLEDIIRRMDEQAEFRSKHDLSVSERYTESMARRTLGYPSKPFPPR